MDYYGCEDTDPAEVECLVIMENDRCLPSPYFPEHLIHRTQCFTHYKHIMTEEMNEKLKAYCILSCNLIFRNFSADECLHKNGI